MKITILDEEKKKLETEKERLALKAKTKIDVNEALSFLVSLLSKFDEDFRFQLSKNEWDEILMSKKLISSWDGSRKLPYAFNEQGIYMLMTV